MSRIPNLLILSIFFFLLPKSNQGQKVGAPFITNFSKSTYQAGTQNWAFVQLPNSLVYFANNKGILEFDGTNWHTYIIPNNTVVRSLAIDENSRIYYGGQNEFGYLEPNEKGENVFTSLSSGIPKEHQSFEDIWQIFLRQDGIYFCSNKAIFHLENEQIKIIKPLSDRFENFFEVGDQLFIRDHGKGLFVCQNNELIPVPGGEKFSDERISAIFPLSEKENLIISALKGLFLFDSNGIKPWVDAASANKFLRQHHAYCAVELADGRYAIGTERNGLLIINKKGIPEVHLNQNNGLQNNTILSLGQDKKDNLWLGLDNGIDYIEINSPFSKIGTEHGITGTGYASIIHKRKLYLGTNQGLFYRNWDESKSLIETPKFSSVENALGQVWGIDKLNDDIILGQHKGASYLSDNQAIPFSKVKGAWKFRILNSNPNYALEGNYKGLFLYENQALGSQLKGKSNWKLVGKINGFEESARIFEEDEDGNIWVSHAYKGIYKIKLSNKLTEEPQVTLYKSSNGLPDVLNLNVVKIRNELVVTSPKGVFRYDKANDQFIPHQDFIEFFGPNRSYYRLLEDELGNIWFSIDNEFGLIQINDKGVFNNFKIHYFNQFQEDLVDGYEHVYAYNESNIFIGAENGFIHFNPLHIDNKEVPFKVLIRKVTLITEGENTLFWGNQNDKANLDEFEFNSKENDFRFTFSAPNFEKSSNLTYRFSLDGFEDAWTNWSPKTEKDYTNLPAGNYIFKVQAKNAFGQISDPDTFAFTISPPWYWTWIAKVAYIILGLLALFLLFQFISKREQKKTEAFKKAETEKLEIKEAELKKEVEISEAEVIKLRNEKLNIDINSKNSQLASATMHLVQKREILTKIKSDLKNIQSEAPPELKKKIQRISRTIDSDIQLDDSWTQFETYFDQVHENFFKRLRQKFPELTPKDQKLCAYLRMNLTTKEIAPLLNISVRGVEVSRYRLRKKLNLEPEVNLVAFVMEV